jgi:hypothetical protein
MVAMRRPPPTRQPYAAAPASAAGSWFGGFGLLVIASVRLLRFAMVDSLPCRGDTRRENPLVSQCVARVPSGDTLREKA